MKVLERHQFTYETLNDLEESYQGCLESAKEHLTGDLCKGYDMGLTTAISFLEATKEVLENHCVVWGTSESGTNPKNDSI